MRHPALIHLQCPLPLGTASYSAAALYVSKEGLSKGELNPWQKEHKPVAASCLPTNHPGHPCLAGDGFSGLASGRMGRWHWSLSARFSFGCCWEVVFFF